MDPQVRQIGVALVFVLAFASQAGATSAIALRSPHRVVLAADSRAIYGAGGRATECKLFEVGDVYAAVSGLAHYGNAYRATDAVQQGFAVRGNFQTHVSATAYYLQHNVQMLMASLQRNHDGQYRYMASPGADLVELAIAESVRGQPMLGIVELRRVPGRGLVTTTTICPGNCRQSSGLYYLGYWDRIQPYVADHGQPRSVGSAASIDRLIRLEVSAHPGDVAPPINILELNGWGARWLQNGGNCSLPGVGW